MPLRILWHGAPPWIPTGYGVVGKHVTSRLARHPEVLDELAWFPIGGPGHSRWEYQGTTMYPTVDLKDLGEGVIDRWAEHFRADVVVSVTDQWVWKTKVWTKFHWVPIAFPDNHPLGRRLVENLKMAYKVIAPTEWGAKALRENGLKNVVYIPLGADTAVFHRDDAVRHGQRKAMIEAARRQGTPYLTNDCFIFGMVARNGTYPTRKGHDIVMDAVGQLLQRGHKDFLVYMHSVADSSHGGIDLIRMVNAYGQLYQDERLARHVVFPPPAQMHMGTDESGFPEERMCALYNAMDVVVNPSHWEGFGLPMIEAGACGIPSIVTDVGCQPEVGAVGWKIPVYRSFYAAVTDTFIADPDLRSLVVTMEKAMRGARQETMREAARRHAEKYDWDDIVENRWLPFLKTIGNEIRMARKGLVAVGG